MSVLNKREWFQLNGFVQPEVLFASRGGTNLLNLKSNLYFFFNSASELVVPVGVRKIYWKNNWTKGKLLKGIFLNNFFRKSIVSRIWNLCCWSPRSLLAQNVCGELLVMTVHEDIELVHASDWRFNITPHCHQKTNRGDALLTTGQWGNIVDLALCLLLIKLKIILKFLWKLFFVKNLFQKCFLKT